MAELTDTMIAGSLNVAGNITVNNKQIITDNGDFKYNSSYYYYIPVVGWHGLVACGMDFNMTVYSSAGITLDYYNVDGEYNPIDTGISDFIIYWDDLPSSPYDYMIVVNGVGSTTNIISAPAYASCQYQYKKNNSFRLITSNGNTIFDGYCEITIIKFVKIK